MSEIIDKNSFQWRNISNDEKIVCLFFNETEVMLH